MADTLMEDHWERVARKAIIDFVRLDLAVRIYLEAIDSEPEKDVMDEDNVSFASDWSHREHDHQINQALTDLRAALSLYDAMRSV